MTAIYLLYAFLPAISIEKIEIALTKLRLKKIERSLGEHLQRLKNHTFFCLT